MDPQVMEEILSAGKKSSRESEASGEGDWIRGKEDGQILRKYSFR